MTKAVTMAGWDDAPHLDQKAKDDLLSRIPPFQRDARSKGIPQLGSGAIYPLEESTIRVEPFAIPSYWPRSYGMDVGWNRTAAIFQAWDREADTVYLYHEHYRGQAEPSIHAAGIRAVAKDWMPGVIDPAARGRSQADGKQLLTVYQDLGLMLSAAQNAVEAGLFEVWERMSTGRLKVFSTCQSWWGEFRLYRRDEKGAVVKVNDHLMDCTRYVVVSGLHLGALAPDYIERSGFARTQPGHQADYDSLGRDKLVMPSAHVSEYDPLGRR